MDREHEEQMLNNFRSEIEAKIKEREREQQDEKMEKMKEMKAAEIEAAAVTEEAAVVETVETEPAPVPVKDMSGDIKVEVHATAVHHDQQLQPKVAHARAHEISHSQAVSYSRLAQQAVISLCRPTRCAGWRCRRTAAST